MTRLLIFPDRCNDWDVQGKLTLLKGNQCAFFGTCAIKVLHISKQFYVIDTKKIHCHCGSMRLFFLYLRLPPSPTTVQCSSHFISSIRSSNVYHCLLYPAQQATFPKFSDLEQCCLYTFINHFRFDSVFNLQNRTRQYFCMNYIDNACMHKFLQNCTSFFKFL